MIIQEKGTDMLRFILRSAIVAVLTLSLGITDAIVHAYPDGQEVKWSKPSPGYAEFEDMDAGNYSDANGQSVILVPPPTIPNSPLAVAFLVPNR